MLPDSAIGRAISACRSESLNSRLYRAVNLNYFNTLASTVGSLNGDNRYTPAGMSNALYLAQTPTLAMLESSRQFQRAMGTPKFPAYTVVPVLVDLQRVLDMTREDNQDALGTSIEELTGDWRAAKDRVKLLGRGRVACHSLGREAMAQGYEAIKYISAYDPIEWNIVLFTENILEGSTYDFELPEPVIALQKNDKIDLEKALELEDSALVSRT